MNDGHLLVAYHGCDITVRDSLVTGRTAIRDSRNEYDWLGSGSYFYEGDPDRALSFADVVSRTPASRLTASPIATPAVVGAVLCVQRTLDILGWFLLPGESLLDDKTFSAAKKRLDEAIATYPRAKPRRKVSVDGRYHAAYSLPRP